MVCNDEKYLRLLAQTFPTAKKVAAEIINLTAILNLPKNTEVFASDVHGEYAAFSHLLKNGAGSVRLKIDDAFADTLSEEEKKRLATLVYYPQDKLRIELKECEDPASFFKATILNLATLCKQAAGKYITFYDDDDEIHPDKLRHQAALLEEKGDQYSCCYCDYSKILGENNIHTNGEHGEGKLYPYMLGRTFYIGSGTNLLVRTSVIKEVGGYNETLRRFEDYELITRITENYLVAYLPEDLMTIHYEVRDNPDLHNVSYEKLVSDDEKYFSIIKSKLMNLPEKQRTMILRTAALERWRYALPRKQTKDAIRNMKENGVSFLLFLRYVFYLIDRVVRKKSYGFKAY